MPVAVACPCGAKLRVPDAAAGKRVKCPKCGNPVSVPAAVAEYEEVDDEPAPPPVAKKKPMLVDDDEPTPAKRPTASRKKAEPVEVNEAVDDDEDDDTPKKKRRRDDDDEDDDTPKKKGKKGKGKKGKKDEAKSKLPLILGIGGGVFVLLTIVGIVVGVMMSGGGGQAQGTAQAPPTKPAGPTLPQGWTKFQGEGFSVGLPPGVVFPEKPDVPPVEANPFAVGSRQWSNKEQAKSTLTGYEVTKVQLKPEMATKFQTDPASAWEELFKGAKQAGGPAGNLTIKPVTFAGGLEGRDLSPPPGGLVKLTLRAVVKGDHLYALTFASQTVEGTDPSVKPFFDTFVIE